MENCAGISSQDTNDWNDFACEKKMDFYCEIRKGKPRVPDTVLKMLI